MKRNSIQVVPSLLSADFGHLAKEAERIEKAGADAIHIDIMDGHFVPNLTMGPKVVAAINRATDLFLDVHLMIYNPFDFVEKFVAMGADRITFHFEATEDVYEVISFIKKCNVEAGLAFNPETGFSMVEPFIGAVDMLLLMTVHPGFGGQKFKEEVLEKVKLTRAFCNRHHIKKHGVKDEKNTLLPYDIQVDGGINKETAKLCVEAGANILVAGTYIFEQKDISEAISSLRG